MFTALLLLVITGFITAVPDTSQTLGSAGLSGYLLAQQYGAHEQRTLTILDLRTGRWRPLWPDSAPASQAADTYGHPTAPAYAAASGTLAFILQTSAQKSIWRASLRAGADGWPSVGEPSPLLADCGGCAALSWSPSGRWLVYDTQSGLMALDTTTGERRQLTSERGDAWPACSPDGRWLAYQRASTAIADIVVLPAADCLPVSSADRAPAYLEGYRPSWRPAWAPDSRHLAFTSNVLGVAHVYVAALAALPPSAAGGVTAAVLVSPGGCEDPAWAPGGAERGAVVIATCDALHAANHQSALVLAATRDSLAWQLRVDEGALMRVTLCWVPAPFLGPRARPQPALDATIIMWAPTAPRLPLSLTTP